MQQICCDSTSRLNHRPNFSHVSQFLSAAVERFRLLRTGLFSERIDSKYGLLIALVSLLWCDVACTDTIIRAAFTAHTCEYLTHALVYH